MLLAEIIVIVCIQEMHLCAIEAKYLREIFTFSMQQLQPIQRR